MNGSNEVFPTLRGVQINVVRTVLAPPVITKTTPSRREYRARNATLPLYSYKLAFEFLRAGVAQELETVVGFFNRRGGSFESFRFTDPADNTAVQQTFGIGNGVATSYQLARSMGAYTEPITELAAAPQIYLGGALVDPGAYTVTSFGRVDFYAGPVGLLTWSGPYYRRVRFVRDTAEFERFMAELWTHKSCELIMTRDG